MYYPRFIEELFKPQDRRFFGTKLARPPQEVKVMLSATKPAALTFSGVFLDR